MCAISSLKSSRSLSHLLMSSCYLWSAVSPKRCKIGGKLALITNRMSYISFRLVPKSVTSEDFERRNGPYFALFLQN